MLSYRAVAPSLTPLVLAIPVSYGAARMAANDG